VCERETDRGAETFAEKLDEAEEFGEFVALVLDRGLFAPRVLALDVHQIRPARQGHVRVQGSGFGVQGSGCVG